MPTKAVEDGVLAGAQSVEVAFDGQWREFKRVDPPLIDGRAKHLPDELFAQRVGHAVIAGQ